MGTPMAPHLPTAADLDAVAQDQQAADATQGQGHPQATPPAHPQPEDQTSVPGDAPDSLPNETSHGEGVKGGPTAPSLDTTKLDDLGHEKDTGIADEGFGPRGKGMPADVLTDAQRKDIADAQERKIQAGLAPTNMIDSTGAAKGAFKVIPQGFDRHGARIPDKVDTSVVIEPVAARVGPRGVGVPNDSWHGKKN
jgi:hypothetical protein